MDSSVRSSRLAGRSVQSGQSLVEAMVAAAILGVGVVTALTALDTMLAGASEATQQAAATCLVRAEVGRLEEAPWNSQAPGDSQGGYPVIDPHVTVTTTGNSVLQVLRVRSTDSAGRTAATATVLKASVLSSQAAPQAQTSAAAWCTYVLRAAP
jgi:Tfp pilus assembly protein PilV